MKSILKNLSIVAVILMTVANVNANVYPTIKLIKDKTVVVNLNDWSNSEVRVLIKQVNGPVIYNDEFQSGEVEGKRYNLKNVADGNYELIIESDTKKAIQEIEINASDLLVRTYKTNIIFKSAVGIAEDAVNFNQLALGRNITFSIGDEKGIFFSKVFYGQTTIHKKFDTSELPAGDYYVVVRGSDQYDTYSFTK